MRNGHVSNRPGACIYGSWVDLIWKPFCGSLSKPAHLCSSVRRLFMVLSLLPAFLKQNSQVHSRFMDFFAISIWWLLWSGQSAYFHHLHSLMHSNNLVILWADLTQSFAYIYFLSFLLFFILFFLIFFSLFLVCVRTLEHLYIMLVTRQNHASLLEFRRCSTKRM